MRLLEVCSEKQLVAVAIDMHKKSVEAVKVASQARFRQDLAKTWRLSLFIVFCYVDRCFW